MFKDGFNFRECDYDNSLNCKNYNLSYDFLYFILKINAVDCYPTKYGFHVSDDEKKSYIICAINSNEIQKYNHLFEILNLFEEKQGNVLGMYSHDSKNIFYDELNDENYVVFKYGNHVKYNDFNFWKIGKSLKDFYSLSESCLKDFKNFNLVEDIEFLKVGQDIKLIEPRIKQIEISNLFIKLFYNKEIKKFLNHHCENTIKYLFEIREFFSSDFYKKYCENSKNIRFINGWLSNRSFVIQDEKIYLCNFYNSSIDLFVKDLASLIEKLIPYFDNKFLIKFILDFIEDFEGDKKEHLEVLKNYIKFNNCVENLFVANFSQFAFIDIESPYFLESKLIKFDNYIKKFNELLNAISSI